MMEEVLIALSGLWLMLPALVPNSAAVLFGGGPPVDLGRSWRGRRLLGDGKTWCGLIGGCAAGVALGTLLMMIALPFDAQGLWGFGRYPEAMVVVLVLSLGSLLGDMGGSFIKRRLGRSRGASMPVLDQYDFLIGSMLLLLVFYPDWLLSNYWEGNRWIALLTVLVSVPLLHRGVNIIGYRMGRKDVPW